MDLVFNHTSKENEWFKESSSGKDNPKSDWYIWRDAKEDGSAPNNWRGIFGGSAWTWCEERQQYYLHTFADFQPDLNWENEKLRSEIYQMMDWWLKKGIDGFRMDVISCISKDQDFPDKKPLASGLTNHEAAANGPRVHEFLQEMNQKVLSGYDIMTVGECAGCTLEEAKKYADLSGNELSMVFEFEHTAVDDHPVLGHYALGSFDLVKLKAVFNKWQTGLEGIAWNSLYWSNHDQVRIVSRWGNDTDTYRVTSAKMLATCLHMMKGTPYIYQGEEIGMTNLPYLDDINLYNDIESKGNYFQSIEKGLMTKEEGLMMMHQRSRDHARTPMQWDDSRNAGFSDGKPWLMVNPRYKEINVKKALSDPDSIFYYYKKLISLRKQYEIIIHGSFHLLEPDHGELFVYERILGKEKLLVITNFSNQCVTYHLPKEYLHADCLITNMPVPLIEGSIEPYAAYVFHIMETA